MPRISIRRICLYAVYTLVGASLVMLAFHVQQQNHAWLHSLQEQVSAISIEKLGIERFNTSKIAYTQDENESEIIRKHGLPWYMKAGGYRPIPGEKVGSVWPEDNKGDRIENQLMLPGQKSEDNVEESEVPVKTIYLPNGLSSWQVTGGRGLFLKQKCPIDRCVLTGRKEDAATADAIMFKDFFAPPAHKRPDHQIWIMYMLECPLHTQLVREKDAFNWTATYRHDSEIVAPYEKWVYFDSKVRRKPVTENFAANKTKKVAWFVSNCGAKNNRLEYAHALQKHIEVDIYGSCGTKNCPRHSGSHCFDILSKDYKFYLAFENSNCRDYITEKFYVNGLGNKVIPIVMGAPREDYLRVAPHHSYIHVDEFTSPEELAEYLHLLDKNDTLYNEYFEWKETGQFINTYFFCRLCAMLHEPLPSQPRYYKDFNKWWRGGMNCIRGSWREYEEYLLTKKSKTKATPKS